MWLLAALFATLIIGAIMLGQSGNMSNSGFTSSGVEVAEAQSKLISDNIKAVFGGSAAGVADFTQLTNSVAIKAGAVPSTMTNGDGQTINGAWNSSISIGGSTGGFFIIWNNVPSTACAKFGISQTGNGLRVNGTWIPRSASGFASAVAAACNQGAGAVSQMNFNYVMNYD